jgi:hypothetical protein
VVAAVAFGPARRQYGERVWGNAVCFVYTHKHTQPKWIHRSSLITVVIHETQTRFVFDRDLPLIKHMMGINDYIWPFQKRFSDIPCAREASIAAIVGGIGLGAASIIITNQTRYAYKTCAYGGFVAFWITFISCRYQHRQAKNISGQFVEALKKGDID